jgi:hypothetical protein
VKQLCCWFFQNVIRTSLDSREYGRGDPLRWPRNTFSPQKLALTSPTSGGLSVGIICSRTKATGFSFILTYLYRSNAEGLHTGSCGTVPRWKMCSACTLPRPPLWSSGQSSWLQIRRPGFDSRHYQKKRKCWVWNGVHSASWVQLRSYLIEK